MVRSFSLYDARQAGRPPLAPWWRDVGGYVAAVISIIAALVIYESRTGNIILAYPASQSSPAPEPRPQLEGTSGQRRRLHARTWGDRRALRINATRNAARRCSVPLVGVLATISEPSRAVGAVCVSGRAAFPVIVIADRRDGRDT